MEIILFILAALFIVLGFIGSIIPAIPGPPLAYLSLIMLQLSDKVQYSTKFLLIWALIVIIVTIIDNFAPIWATKKFGGSRWGTIGSIIGLLVGIFFSPIGIILGTFLGAIIGELIYTNDWDKSIKSGIGSLLGFLMGSGLKLICCGFFLYYFIQAL